MKAMTVQLIISHTSNEPPQFECSVVRTDHTLPNVEAIDFIRNGSYDNQVHQLPQVRASQ